MPPVPIKLYTLFQMMMKMIRRKTSLDTLLHQKHTSMIGEVTDKIRNITLSALKQINIERFSLKS